MRIIGIPVETVSFATNGIAINGKPLANPSDLSGVKYVSLDKLFGYTVAELPVRLATNEFLFWAIIPPMFTTADFREHSCSNIVGKIRFK